MSDPWYKSTFDYLALGAKLKIAIPHDVFSTQRIDEGTLLLLDHLPENQPHHILDMGCGYGALGLPIAAKFSAAKVEMVDRDLLAVAWSTKNAHTNQLTNVDAYGSLGFRDVKAKHYDWILCNVPARIGTPFIKELMESGGARLNPDGELRVVVINDLSPVLEALKKEFHWQLTEIAVGPRHSIFAMKPHHSRVETLAPHQLYFRDEVKIQGLTLDRPFDFGGDDQKRLQTSLPILIDTLPRKALTASQNILCIRAAYGALPLICRTRYPEANVVAIERDLLGTSFIQHNAEKLNLSGERLEIREAQIFSEALKPHEKFDLILGELSPSAGEAVALHELNTMKDRLKKGGQALILCLEKNEKDWVRKFAETQRTVVARVLTRENYSVVRIENT